MKIITKKSILILLVIVWIVFSAGYIAYDQWQDFKTGQMQVAYQQGLIDSVRTIMNESTKCQPIPLLDGDKQVNIIAVECLQQVEQQPEQQVSE